MSFFLLDLALHPGLDPLIHSTAGTGIRLSGKLFAKMSREIVKETRVDATKLLRIALLDATGMRTINGIHPMINLQI